MCFVSKVVAIYQIYNHNSLGWMVSSLLHRLLNSHLATIWTWTKKFLVFNKKSDQIVTKKTLLLHCLLNSQLATIWTWTKFFFFKNDICWRKYKTQKAIRFARWNFNYYWNYRWVRNICVAQRCFAIFGISWYVIDYMDFFWYFVNDWSIMLCRIR